MASAYFQGFAKNTTSFALDTRAATGTTPQILNGFLRDASTVPPPLLVTSTGPFTMHNGLLRDANYNLATIDTGSAAAPTVFQRGFLLDANGLVVTTAAPTNPVYQESFVRDGVDGPLVVDVV